jgi:hypothetical protein
MRRQHDKPQNRKKLEQGEAAQVSTYSTVIRTDYAALWQLIVKKAGEGAARQERDVRDERGGNLRGPRVASADKRRFLSCRYIIIFYNVHCR